ncbi:MAG TPA: AMP-binding protein [Methylibium sp.]|nr:AMP-binding protein [Methylibium sp.]
MTALVTAGAAWSRAELDAAAARLAEALSARRVRVLATLLDNGASWAIVDAAAARAGVVHVPLPAFFTAAQRRHAVAAAGVDTLCAEPAVAPDGAELELGPAGLGLAWRRLPTAPVAMPAGTAKVTFTSGTTGTPKGVCLGADAIDAVARGIGEATAPLGIERHLSALPYAVLLENIAGLMAPLARGASCIALPLAEVGLSGSSSFDPATLQAACERHQPHSLILLPQMLRAWSVWLTASGRRAPAALKLVAVGGAAVGAPLLAAARAAGIPAYEGYGLSEGVSVQTLNLPGADRPGSAGRPLPHARLRIAADGEIEVGGALHLGYLGSAEPLPAWWPSGDLGTIDADGYLHVRGRKKQVLITAYGRNVSPEWVECALHAARVRGQPVLAQAVVFGDGAPVLSAVLWPVDASLPDAVLQAAVDAANATLPDYAQVRDWVRASRPYSADSGLATANGRPQRDAIARLHAGALRAAATD